jgi:uncharacterized protein
MTRLIDTDSHAVEAADLWTSRMSAKWGPARPHIRYVPEQDSDVWFIEDTPIMHAGFTVMASSPDGLPVRQEERYPAFITKFDEMHPSAWDPSERAKVMDAFGISAAALYPNLGFIGPDIYRVLPNSPLDYQVEIAAVYNDWILSWAEAQPGRFIPLACIPYWDVPSAINEIERCAELGHHGFVMTGVPQSHGEPFLADPHWNPMWSAAQATGLPISFHAGGGGNDASRLERQKRIVHEGWEGSLVRANATEFFRNGITAADLLMSGVLPRFPDLRFITVESGIGWIPFMLECLDWHFKRYNLKARRTEFKELPSFYFKRQMFANVWFEELTDWHIKSIGADNILFETDYPHPTCLYDDEIQATVNSSLGGLDSEVREKILWKNASRLFRFEFELAQI